MLQHRWLLIAVSVCLGLSGTAQADDVDFEKDVAPILEKRCLGCHSANISKGDLSLSTAADLQQNGYVIPGDVDGSYLWEVVSPQKDKPPRMPKDGPPLDDKERAALKSWISQGAKWPNDVVLREQSKADASWWSLQPLRLQSPAGQAIPGDQLSQIKIDDYIEAKLKDNNLTWNPPAARRTLIRRVTFDLTGLPPTPKEVEAFVNSTDPAAYEQLIDRLLASPHYGERWGRHWLDVVRFGESNGFERNVLIPNLWPFRDYVIESLNADKPFDEFIREHLAGDVISGNDPRTAIGTAFLVAGPYDDVGNQDPVQAAQIRANTLDEMIRATTQAFLGMTVGCARCHDHKFDPIAQEDYYKLYATFAAVKHGSTTVATAGQRRERSARLGPLNEKRDRLTAAAKKQRDRILARAKKRRDRYERFWTKPPVDRTGTEEWFAPVTAAWVRLVCESQDRNPNSDTGFGIDEFEVWSAGNSSRNVALLDEGAKAFGTARSIEDFPGAYGPQLAIDGKTGARFLARGNTLTVQLAEPTSIQHIVFSSAKNEQTPGHSKFTFVSEYRIEVSMDGKTWTEIASSRDRRPLPSPSHVEHRLLKVDMTDEEAAAAEKRQQRLATVNRAIASVPSLPVYWIGRRDSGDRNGPFHVFQGGDPQRKSQPVVPGSFAVLSNERFSPEEVATFELTKGVPESNRRLALADWIVDPKNPLTPRVLANRIWHYHFGTGLVDTPSDFGYMGGRPSHPKLLDFLAAKLIANGWKIKALHREILLSRAYRQSAESREDALKIDADSRLLWRFPPRRLSAEEIRDSILFITGKLDRSMGGPGFRLYRFMQDNVCTYTPLDQHGPETYRRAVYHQNARASVVDLMTDFDQPDCAFSTPRRAETTTPLQALTMLNHNFTLDMSRALADRAVRDAGSELPAQIKRVYQLCFQRPPTEPELARCLPYVKEYGLESLCRVLLNTSELIFVR